MNLKNFMENERNKALHLLHIAGMTLVATDGVFKGPNPTSCFTKAMDYKTLLSKSIPQVSSILKSYDSKLPDEYRGLLENEENLSYKLIEQLEQLEKKEGLLRKLL
jgi:hypothetical protein